MRRAQRSSLRLAFAAAVLGLSLAGSPVLAQSIDPAFAGSYTLTDLHSVPGVTAPYGGLTFLNNNTLLVGGRANSSAAEIDAIMVARDVNGHITGFTGSATFYASAPGINSGTGLDGGLQFGPGGVLFYTSYNDNSLGQLKPGSTSPDKQTNLTPLGVAGSVGSLAFVPTGFASAGHLKLVSLGASTWYDTTVTPDGTGTFTVNPVGPGIPLFSASGPDGIVYVKGTNPVFGSDSVLVSETSRNDVVAYTLDANGNPIVGTRRKFVRSVTSPEGGTVDPVTGDFLFATFSAGNHIYEVRGLQPQASAVPEPASLTILGLGAVSLVGYTWRRQKKVESRQ